MSPCMSVCGVAVSPVLGPDGGQPGPLLTGQGGEAGEQGGEAGAGEEGEGGGVQQAQLVLHRAQRVGAGVEGHAALAEGKVGCGIQVLWW